MAINCAAAERGVFIKRVKLKAFPINVGQPKYAKFIHRLLCRLAAYWSLGDKLVKYK